MTNSEAAQILDNTDGPVATGEALDIAAEYLRVIPDGMSPEAVAGLVAENEALKAENEWLDIQWGETQERADDWRNLFEISEQALTALQSALGGLPLRAVGWMRSIAVAALVPSSQYRGLAGLIERVPPDIRAEIEARRFDARGAATREGVAHDTGESCAPRT